MTITEEFEFILREQVNRELDRLAEWRERMEEARRAQLVQKFIDQGYPHESAEEEVRHGFYQDMNIFSEWQERTDEVRAALLKKIDALYDWARQTGRMAA